MPWFVLRVEGVNFDATVLDTQDLSCIRGASLALLHAPRRVAAVLSGQAGLAGVKTIFDGASMAAFTFRAETPQAENALEAVRHALTHDGEDAEAVREAAASAGPTLPPLAHMSFVVALAVAGGGDDQAIGRALAVAEAKNRAAQLRSLTVRLPPDGGASGPDPLSRVLPADTDIWLPKEKERGDDPGLDFTPVRSDAAFAPKPQTKVSRSVAARRHYGRHMRQAFYRDELAAAIDAPDFFDTLRFTDSIETLCADRPAALTSPEQIGNKIGVLYFDGNKFGRIRERMSGSADPPSPSAVTRFSEELKAYRRELLADVIGRLRGWRDHPEDSEKRRAWVLGKEDGGRERRTALRFETLMWGGDELLWVVPSWLALGLAERVFTASRNWEIAGERLTHAGGVVICDRKTPIRQAVALAKALAEGAKTVKAGADGAPVNALQIEVFESVDLPDPEHLDAHRRRLYRGLEDAFPCGDDKAAKDLKAAFTLSGDALGKTLKRLAGLKAGRHELPRSQLHRLLRVAGDTKAFAYPPVDDASDPVWKELDAYWKNAGRHRANEDGAKEDRAKEDFDWWKTGTQGWDPAPPRSMALRLALAAQLWDYVDPFGDDASEENPK